MSDFLFEIGLEEIPARMIAGAQAELLKRVTGLLERERLIAPGSAATSYSTPRRLAVLVPGLLDRQPDLTEELLGPATKIAYKDGVPGPAALAFAKKSGVTVEDLRTVSTAKGDYLAATSTRLGSTAAEVLTAELPKELAAIYWAKNMYWRAGKPERFVRPVRWLVALLGAETVPVEFGGYTAGRETFGHRVLFGPQPIELASAAQYVDKLLEGHVMAEVELRRHTIRKALDRVCRAIPDARWREDHALVDKMTHLTEWPSVIAGDFDPAYLTLPGEVLVTVMRDHQNYFAVESADGKLAPHFLAVLNTAADSSGEATIRHGNARVLRARFNDARFFWDFDQRTPLEDRVAMLENVTFQKDLGSYARKSERILAIAHELGTLIEHSGGTVDLEALGMAARLCKTDLTTELVKEFTELQGDIGGLYARAQGLPAATANAISGHYHPVSTEGRIPATVEGRVLAIADKIDTIAGLFSLGMEPTGSKDPFALRRAANGIVKILAESTLPIQLREVIASTHATTEVAGKLQAFFGERIEFYLREVKGQAYDTVKAVMALGCDDLRQTIARAQAVTAARTSPDFEAVSAGFKRMSNILAQAADKGIAPATSVDDSLLTPGAETAFAFEVQRLSQTQKHLLEAGSFAAALDAMAGLRPAVDAFFDAVMILDPDERVRGNRLALLRNVLAAFAGIAEFSEIVTAG